MESGRTKESPRVLPILDSMKDSYADNFDFMNLTFCVCVRIVLLPSFFFSFLCNWHSD